MSLGLMNSPDTPPPPGAADPTRVPFAMGIVPMESLAQIQARERQAAERQNNAPIIQNLAAHVRTCWSAALNAKRTTDVETRMLQSMRQRRGEYDPEVLSEIKRQGGSEIYMMLTSNKCRAAASWIRDVMLGTRGEKPWTIEPTPLPDLPDTLERSIEQIAAEEMRAFQEQTQQVVSPADATRFVEYMRDRVIANAKKRAREACAKMELKMEDQLVEGGFQKAISEFIEDLVTFPSAVIKGPVVRRKKRLTWGTEGDRPQPIVTDELVLEWERVDPFMLYPAPHCTNIDDGYLIERHRLTRQALNDLIGVEGYSEEAIRAVLSEHGRGGLNEWLYIDSAKASVEGKSMAYVMSNPEATIDALQFWGSVQGKMLVELGMDADQVPDQERDYPCELWLIGSWVIKAVVNSDQLGRKPYFKASYEEVPGAFWGNSVADLCRDAQSQCNVAARAIANNMGIASGPQVMYNVDRLPSGEDLTQMYPWKVWQTTSDPYGTAQKPVEFFMPSSIAGELMQIFEFFSRLADEHTGIPRYMTGDGAGAGALRTSSGMSMLMNNAGKAIKQVIANIDAALQLLIERLHYTNMINADDSDLLLGDIKIVARGANSLIVKETQQQRMNEFLQLALTNPIVNQIVGEEAIASILRVAAKQLDLDTDQIVPPPEVIRARVMQMRQSAAAADKATKDFQLSLALAPSHQVKSQVDGFGNMLGAEVTDTIPHVMPAAGAVPMGGPMGGQAGGNPARTMSNPNQTLAGGRQITDNFSPMRH